MTKEEAYERVLSAGRKLRRALIIWGAVLLSAGAFTLLGVWLTMEEYSGLISVFEYVVMAIVGVAAICMGLILFVWASSLSPKKRKSSLR